MADFFTTPIKALTLAEVQPLFNERVAENIRLEYKREVPPTDAKFKEELAKALSSFANTYGGYFVVGISTDAAGNPTAMDGVPTVASYQQRVSSTGYQEVYPPLLPVVSNPIALPSGNVIYVVYQDLSLEAPHFLTRRLGAYVRTNEFSQTFQPALATWEDLRFLANRREQAVSRRRLLHERARSRANRIVPSEVWKQNPTTLVIWTGPLFPSKQLVPLESLQGKIEKASLRVRSTTYPSGDPISLQETFGYISSPDYSESNAFGMLFAIEPYTHIETPAIIPALLILSRMLLWIRYGVRFLQECGYDGQVHLRAALFRVSGKQVFWSHEFPGGFEVYECREEDVDVEAELDLQIIAADIGEAALRLFNPLMFAAGWRRVFQAPRDNLIARALEALGSDARFLRLP